MFSSKRRLSAVLLLCLAFLFLGLLFIPYLGMQQDEALFAVALLVPAWTVSRFTIAPGFVVPLMLLSYVGALKSWFYAALLQSLSPSVYLLRVPVLLLGAVTIYLFSIFVRRTCGNRGALIAAALLATDSTYLLTSCFDWGPVVFQHFLLVSGALLFMKFFDSGRDRYLYGGSFVFGLAVWDKAVFLWTLAALLISVSLLYRDVIFRNICVKGCIVAVVVFSLGASPFLAYNLQNGWTAFVFPSPAAMDLGNRWGILRSTLDGSSLYGYLVREENAPPSAVQLTSIERCALFIETHMGEHSQSPMVWLLGASIAMLPFRRSKTAFAGMIALTLAYTFMLLSNGGGAAHHVVLLWPLPQFVIAAIWAEPPKWSPWNLTAVLVGSICTLNLLNANHYLVRASQGGSGLLWTDATSRLVETIGTNPMRMTLTTDWGIAAPLLVMEKARAPVFEISDLLTAASLTAQQQQFLSEAVASPENTFVGHTDGNELLSGVNAKLQAFAQSGGYTKANVRRVCDRHGRPIYEVFGFVAAAAHR